MSLTWTETKRSDYHGPLPEHVLIVSNPDDPIAEVLHPESCTVWVGSKPDSWGQQKRYECAVTSEIENMGYAGMFPDGLTVGMWLLSPWWSRTPSTPSHAEEWDAGIEVMSLHVAEETPK